MLRPLLRQYPLTAESLAKPQKCVVSGPMGLPETRSRASAETPSPQDPAAFDHGSHQGE
jgi:hypothetical protein